MNLNQNFKQYINVNIYMTRFFLISVFLLLISCSPNTPIVKKEGTQTVDKVIYGTIKSSTPVKIESEGIMGALLGGVIGGIVGGGDILQEENTRNKAEVYGAVVGAIIGYITETKIGNHDGFQYIIDVKDDDKNIAVVQVSKDPIENGRSVVIVIGDKVIISPYDG